MSQGTCTPHFPKVIDWLLSIPEEKKALFRTCLQYGRLDYKLETTISTWIQPTYVKWVTTQLVPNLQPQTVLVIDNVKYHVTQVDKAPTSKSRKDEMIKWLIERNIHFETSMLIPQLYKIMLQYKPLYFKYVLDSILEKEGHSVCIFLHTIRI